MRFTLKRGDTAPPLTAQLLDGNKKPVMFDGTETIQFFMVNRDPDGPGGVAGKDAVLVDTKTATIEYRWEAEDTQYDGVFDGEIRVTFIGGAQESFPNGEYVNVVILPGATPAPPP